MKEVSYKKTNLKLTFKKNIWRKVTFITAYFLGGGVRWHWRGVPLDSRKVKSKKSCSENIFGTVIFSKGGMNNLTLG